MNGYLQQSYILFLENNQARIENIAKDNQLDSIIKRLEKILIFFRYYNICALEKPEKLFEFLFF